jgi:hypothetical protein
VCSGHFVGRFGWVVRLRWTVASRCSFEWKLIFIFQSVVQ